MEEHGVPLLHVELHLVLVVHIPHAVIHLVHSSFPLRVVMLVKGVLSGKQKAKRKDAKSP